MKALTDTLDLNALREAIDQADDRLFNALRDRAELVAAVGEYKNGGSVLRPAREAAVLRRLLQKQRGRLPVEAVVQTWRGLFGIFCRMQGGLKASVISPDDLVRAAEIFGSYVPVAVVPGNDAALQTAANDRTSVALLPLTSDWWTPMYLYPELRVTALFPFITFPEDREAPLVAVAQAPFEPSGDDLTFAVDDAGAALPDGVERVIAEHGGKRLLLLRGFHTAQEGATILGGTPRPLIFNRELSA